MICRRITYLGILGGCLVFYFCHQQWISWIILLCAAVLPWLSLVLSLPAMLQFRAEVEAPDHILMGEAVHVSLWGLSNLPQPRFLGKLTREDLLTGRITRHNPNHPLPTAHCGGIRIGVKKLRICDYLGLFATPTRSVRPHILVVRPRPVPMEEIPDLTRGDVRSWKPKHGGGFAENHELRLYRPGDCLNQVHWKLSAKTGRLILREPMEPCLETIALTVDLKGTPDEIDLKFGRLLWLSRKLLEQDMPHEVRCLTAQGVIVHAVADEHTLIKAIDDLLCRPAATEGTLLDRATGAVRQFHVGGDCHEA